MEEKFQILENENDETIQTNMILREENSRLMSEMGQLQSENIELNKMRSTILSTLDKTVSPKKSIPSGATHKRSNTPVIGANPNFSVQLSCEEEGPDGKSFFAATKERLGPEEFKEFVQIIKKYRNKELSKTETIECARNIFGEQNEDLYSTLRELMLV